jgi:hypothetical protein
MLPDRAFNPAAARGIALREVPELLLRDGDLLFNRTKSSEFVGKSAGWDRG